MVFEVDLFSLREREIFESLKSLSGLEFVVIGGYAVNAFTLPRFSDDCDIVTREPEEMGSRLKKRGFNVVEARHDSYQASFERLEKTLENYFKVSFDVLINAVFDRRMGSSFSAGWVFEHSSVRKLPAKTFNSSIETRVIDLDALVALKLVASRKPDLRDVFMLAPKIGDHDFVRREVSERTSVGDALKRAATTILSKQFRNNLQGVYGLVNDKVYEKHVIAFRKLLLH